MKIGIVAPFGFINNEIAHYAIQMIDCLKEYHQVTTIGIMPNNASLLTRCDIKIQQHSVNDYVDAAFQINQNCDLCILHHRFQDYGLADGAMVLTLVNNLQIPFVVIMHNVSHHVTDFQRQISEALCRSANSVIVMSTLAANIVEHLYKAPIEKIKVLPYIAPSPSLNSREALRTKLGIGNEQLLVSFGMIEPGDGLPLIIRALSGLNGRMPNWRYVHIGVTEGNELALNDRAYLAKLLIDARKHKTEDRVFILNQQVSDELLMEYLVACDIMLLPQPNMATIQCRKINVGMAAGAAILSSPYLLAKEFLGDKMGDLFSFDDGSLLAEHLFNLLNNKRQLTIYRQAAGDWGSQFKWSALAPKYLTAIEQAYGKGTTAASLKNNSSYQLLLSPFHPFLHCSNCDNSLKNQTLLAWQFFMSANYQRFLNLGVATNGCKQHVYNICEALHQAEKMDLASKNNLQKQLCTQSHAFLLFTIGYWLSVKQSECDVETLRQYFVKEISCELFFNTNESLALITLGCCYYLRTFPTDELVVNLLKKTYKQLFEPFKLVQQNWPWPEKVFSSKPALIAWALLEASVRLGDKTGIEKSVTLSTFLLQKSFEEGIFVSVLGKGVNAVKSKRIDKKQPVDEAVWTAFLARQMGLELNSSEMLDYAWRCYLWFIGENSSRTNLVDLKGGKCYACVDETQQEQNIQPWPANIFGSVLALAYNVQVQKMVIN